MLGCKSASTFMDFKNKFRAEKEGVPIDKGRYQHLVGKLIYLSHTRSNIRFVVSVMSQFLNSSMEEYTEVAYRILRYLNTPGKGLLFKKIKDRKLILYYDVDWA